MFGNKITLVKQNKKFILLRNNTCAVIVKKLENWKHNIYKVDIFNDKQVY